MTSERAATLFSMTKRCRGTGLLVAGWNSGSLAAGYGNGNANLGREGRSVSSAYFFKIGL
jgi:hypothetical protein